LKSYQGSPSIVKIREGKAYYRGEESLTLNQILPEALDNIRRPYKSHEMKIDHMIQLLEDESALESRVYSVMTNNGTDWSKVIDGVKSSLAWFQSHRISGPSLRAVFYRVVSLEANPNTNKSYKS
jgi:hypothetical protein